MKKYNLSKIMKRAWELVKKSVMTMSMSAALVKAWSEAKATRATVTFTMNRESFTVNAITGVVTGKTYHSKEFLKDYFAATWDKEVRLWTVDTETFNAAMEKEDAWYKRHITAETMQKSIVSRQLVNRHDGFYEDVCYSDGSRGLVFVG